MIAALLFSFLTVTYFAYLDVKSRWVSNKILIPVFLICVFIYFVVDFLILKTVTVNQFFLGFVFAAGVFLMFTVPALFGLVGPADIKIFAAFSFLSPVYFIEPIGVYTFPPIDVLINYIIFAVPVYLLFKKVQPGELTPALVTVGLGILTAFAYGNVVMTFLDVFIF